MLRRNANTVLALSVAGLIASLIGVRLGHSAVGAINPLYFQGEAPPPKAADASAIRQPGPSAYQRAYGWAEGNATRAIACSDNCGPPEPYNPYAFVEAPPAPRLAGPHWRDATPTAELEPWPAGHVGGAPGRAVARYADFPIEEKPDEAKPDRPRADDQEADIYE